MTEPKLTASTTPDDIARQRELGWPDLHPEDYCHRCGGRNMLWFADASTWNAATAAWAAETGREGICCPQCFAEMAAEHGVGSGIWHLAPEGEVAALRRQVDDLRAEHGRALESARKLFVETRDLRNRAEAAEAKVADLTTDRDHFKARLAVRYAEMDETRDRLEALANKNFARAEKAESEQAYTYGLARKAHERAEAAKRALAAQAEVIAQVRESVEHIAMRHRTTWNGRCWECGISVPKAGCPTLIAASSALATLDGPAPQPDEGATLTLADAVREAERLRTGLRCLHRDWAEGWENAEPFDQRDAYRAVSGLLGGDYANDVATWLPPTTDAEEATEA